MGFASQLNKGGIQWGVDSTDFPYIKCEELYNMGYKDEKNIIVCKGLFINRNKDPKQLKEYGPSVVAITEDKLVNFPNHMVEDVEANLSNEEFVSYIKEGKLGFYIHSYESHGKTCYSPTWVDIE